MITAKIGEETINCYDGKYDRETLKKWSKKKIIKCPACGEDYTYNHGRVVQPYFKHINAECSLYGEPETEEHMNGKRDLYEWVKSQNGVTEAKLEGWLPDTKQRPDVMFKYNGKQYVIEYQCSPIATEYYERHELYQAAGIKDIWICGTNKYLYKEENIKSLNFKEKELEKVTSFYYDSEYKLIILKNYKDFDFLDNYMASFSIPNISYQKTDRRKSITDDVRVLGNGNLCSKLINITFEDEIKIRSDYINTLKTNLNNASKEYSNVCTYFKECIAEYNRNFNLNNKYKDIIISCKLGDFYENINQIRDCNIVIKFLDLNFNVNSFVIATFSYKNYKIFNNNKEYNFNKNNLITVKNCLIKAIDYWIKNNYVQFDIGTKLNNMIKYSSKRYHGIGVTIYPYGTNTNDKFKYVDSGFSLDDFYLELSKKHYGFMFSCCYSEHEIKEYILLLGIGLIKHI